METLKRFYSLNKQLVFAGVAVLAIVAQLGAGVIFADGASAAGELEPVAVTNEVELRAELQAGNSVKLQNEINITSDSIVIDRKELTIDGQGHAIVGEGFPTEYNENGDNYIIKVYKSTVTFTDVSIFGANAAIHVNQSNVTLAGKVEVDGE